MRYRLSVLFILLSAAPLAHAHGEEILVSFYAQAIVVVACFAGLQFLSIARPHRLAGAIACIAGVVFAELSVSNIPYNDNRILITIAMIVAPIIATVGFVLIGRAYAKRKKKN